MLEFLLSFILIILVVLLVIVGIGIFVLCKLLGGFSNVKKLFRKLTGIGSKKKKTERVHASGNGSSGGSASKDGDSAAEGGASTGGKMFSKNEGTYVDFEEVK
ncbi:MAG: DUF4834 family protein [Prevotellaceae bacterium]|nr:DUF4834 family protein [Candidatus Minthosoma caballi]